MAKARFQLDRPQTERRDRDQAMSLESFWTWEPGPCRRLPSRHLELG
jgi:hypothetical protein